MTHKKEVSLQVERFPRGEDAEFRIRSKKEMQFILQDIAEKDTRVILYYDGPHNFILTTLLGANEDGIWLDVGPHAPENNRILNSEEIFFVSMHQGVKVQFAADGIQMASLEGSGVFFLELPDFLLRIQRREFFRLSIPTRTPVMCIIPILPENPDEPPFLREVPLVDISGGGVGLLCGKDESVLLPGKTYQGCRISLPDTGILTANIEVRNGIIFTLHNDIVHKRVGCQFIRLDNQMTILLQRYITQLQTEALVHE
jgi:c-di-GMP-binding flagellar brake protein YcgR